MGRLFREFAVTLAVAITMSAVVSLTVTPMMAARLLVSAHERRESWLARRSERFFQGLARGYDRSLRAVLAHAWLMLGVVLGAVALTVMLLRIVPTTLFPQQDNGLLIGFSEAPQDVSYTTMRDRQMQVNQILGEDPDIASVVSFIGGGPGGGGANTGSVFITLKPRPPRKASADQIIARLRPKLAKLVGINLFLQAAQDVRIGGRLARTQYQYTLQDPDLTELNTWAPRVFERLKRVPELTDVATDQQSAGLELRLTIDRDSAARLGVSVRDIDDALYDAFGQRQISVTYGVANQYRVVMEVTPGVPRGRADPGEALRPVELRRPGAALGAHHHHPGQPAHRHQPPGPVPLGHPLLQPGAREVAGRCGHGGARRRAGDPSAGQRAGRLHRQRPGLPAVALRPDSGSSSWRWSRSTSCSGCSTRATSTRSPSSPRCPRPGWARSWLY